MHYNLKQQLPYIIMLSLLNLAYYYFVYDQLLWWHYASTIPSVVGLLWIVKKFLQPQAEYSVMYAIKGWGPSCIMISVGNTYVQYIIHKTINIPVSLLLFSILMMIFVIAEHSIYD